ncbi:hypothetical protein ANN_26744 [Periplaneta americana]|uniref:DUF4817 domain-containing protein n=1 Tax=Periplaneta americana TaxID=6978 RepID=A0ABQ8RZG4_PERAM|nr:hypothetical protein ANN_26744 [Periplaneta americana]
MYTNIEYAHMHLVYGAAEGNAFAARRRYRDLFPRRQLPSHQIFAGVDRHMRKYGIRSAPRTGRPRVHVEDNVLDMVDQDPAISTRAISAALGISQCTVWCMLRRLHLYPFHLQKVQELTTADYPHRRQFCHWLLQRKFHAKWR